MPARVLSAAVGVCVASHQHWLPLSREGGVIPAVVPAAESGFPAVRVGQVPASRVGECGRSYSPVRV